MNPSKSNALGNTGVVDLLTTAPWPSANRFRDLAEVALVALRLSPSNYFRSVFGTPLSWLPPHRRFSEYNIINPWQLLTTARFLMDITIPSYAVAPPGWARTLFPTFINRRFWRPTSFFRQPDEYGGVSSFPGEHWFFINGIATNQDVAKLNGAYLAHLFHRPVTVIQNATNSWPVDIYECAIGKGFKDDPDSLDRKTMTEPAWRATAAILEALNADQTRRVVVIAHSQGTIIAANVLRAVAKALRSKQARQKKPRWHLFTNELMGEVKTETEIILRNSLAHSLSVFAKGGPDKALERLNKLEIYTFANCADKMRYVYPSRQVPYMEHFANEQDIVARLGILSPLRDGANPLIEIDGTVFEQKAAWGHLLNEHYLNPIDDYLYPGESKYRRERDPYPGGGNQLQKPRLYKYFHGKRPEGLHCLPKTRFPQ
jgi:hypothetical protein